MWIEFKQVGLLALAIAVGACSAGNAPSTGNNNGAGGGTQTGKGGGSSSGGMTSSGNGGNSNNTNGGNSNNTNGGNSNNTNGGSSNNTNGGSSNNTNGGSTSGGSNNGNNGGSNNGGSSSNGGSSNAGASNGGGTSTGTGGGTSTGNTPAGYWTYKDWHGCVWTGVDTVTVAPHKSTITPQDFTAQAGTSGPYHVSGTVGQDPKFNGTALLGFNLNQDAAGANCAYNASAATSMGPPGVTFDATAKGIAVNFSKTGSTGVVRIQIQGPNGATDANNRWCYTLTQTQGKDFAPFNRFFTQCWNDDGTGKSKSSTDSIGTVYNGTDKISAIAFNVPGDSAKDLPFDFTVNGFALGSSAADAPDGGTLGSLSGTIGGADTNGSTDHDFQRVKVNASSHSYIIQNNNWGNPSGTDQTITYKDNSFSITGLTGGDPGGGSVRAFPSIYIGSNGNTMSGAFSTSGDDSLPKKVSAIQSVQTTFKWGGGKSGGNYNVAYDVWFGPTPAAQFPYYPEYKDGQSGFIMVWLYKPSQNNPIGGSPAVSGRTVAGVSGTWNVYAGPRGGGGSNSGVPVISYVATSTQQSMTFDLNNFIKDAVTNGAGGLKISQDSYLTDVFAGFEIWTGADAFPGSGQGLQVQEFTAVVK